jgi:hypothetical protein
MNLSMKKIFGIALLALSLGFGFTSCSDDDEPSAPSTPACEAAAGVYSGTWSRTLNGETTSAEGTLTFEATDSAATVISAKCDEIAVDYSSTANITYAITNEGTGFIFTNGVASNGFGATFSGRISAAGKANISFTKTVKEGRKNYTYTYSFEGNKQ